MLVIQKTVGDTTQTTAEYFVPAISRAVSSLRNTVLVILLDAALTSGIRSFSQRMARNSVRYISLVTFFSRN